MADRPALTEEFEITPEMIQAGVAVLCASVPLWDMDREIVERVYKAMRALEHGALVRVCGGVDQRAAGQ